MPVRIYDISKKLGLENKEVLSKAKELGIAAARVASSSLDKITAEYLEQQLVLAHPNLSAPPPPPAAPQAPVEPIVVVTAPPPPPPQVIQEPETTTMNGSAVMETEPAVEETAPVEAQPVSEAAPAMPSIEAPVHQPPPPPVETPAPTAQAPAPAPAAPSAPPPPPPVPAG